MNATDHARGGVCTPARRLAAALAALLLGGAVLAQAPPEEAPAPIPVAAAKIMVADVIPQGLHAVPPGRVTSLIKTRVGAEFSQATLDEDVRRLYETRSFANIQVQTQTARDGGVLVYFQFSELPSVVQDIVFQGAKHFKPDELEKEAGLRRGMPLNPVANRQACYKIEQHYFDKGRLLASVELVEGGRPGDTRIVFNITEGPKARVKSIGFTGVHFVTQARLRTQVNASAAFLGLLGGSYNPAMVDADVAKLEEYYRTWGFHDVHVSREVQWEPDQQYVHVIFHVSEGTRYRVHDVDVQGTSAIGRDELLPLVKLKPGEFVDEGKTKIDINRMKAYEGYRGRDSVVVEQVTYRQDQPGQADIHYRVEERPPATVGEIRIIGNTVTRENVIRRQIPLYSGQVLSYPDLRQAEANLARLNIFESNPELGVRPTVGIIDDDPNNPVKDVLVNVQETATGSLMFGLGVNSDAGLTGSIVLNERNFDICRPPTSLDDLLSGRAWRGAGQEFRLEAVPGTQLQRYTASWREPFLFDSPYSLGVSGYYYDRIYNEYRESRLGTRISLGRKLNDKWSASGTVRIEEVGVHDVASFAPADFQNVVGNNFLLGFQAALTRDTRDSYLRATEGSMVQFAYEQVTGDFNFPVFSIEANKYWTIYQRPDQSGRHVLAYHGQVAATTTDAPVFERFYAGGFRSMRGFEFRGVGPDVNGFKVGGDFMFLNSLEYQIPIKANDQIYVVGFVDSGTVDNDLRLNNYRVSAGVGLRVVVPMLGPVPIALDFGFPIRKADTDKEQVFSFWVGFFH